MSRKLEKKEIVPQIIKRSVQRNVGVFVDGVALDRACKRLKKRVDYAALLASISLGTKPTVARYYTIVPLDDDSRQRSYLDAVERAGFDVILKRLPPKGVDRMVSVEPEMAADIIAFGLKGSVAFSDYPADEERIESATNSDNSDSFIASPIVRSIVLGCPSKELSYAILLLNKFEIETTTADFGAFSGRDVLKSSSRWIDLTGSEMIWRE